MNTKIINVKSITSDFELRLIDVIKLVLKDIQHIGCLFHYVKNIRLKMSKYGFFSKFYKNLSNDLFHDLSALPFIYNDEISNIKNIFNKYKNIAKHDDTENNKILYNILIEFEKYYNSNWKRFFKNNALNYKIITKEERSNSYLENYNKRIRDKLCKYIFFLIKYYSTFYKLKRF